MLTCVIDAQEDRDIVVVDIPNAFVQTVVDEDDAKHRVIVRIRGLLVDILVPIAPDVYGMYVTTNKSGESVDCRVPQRRLWYDGGSTTVLQEVCEEPYQARFQAQFL